MGGMLQINRLTVSGGTRDRLHDVCVTIPLGRTALVGYSGAGKTSLLNVLAGFEKPDRGSVKWTASKTDSERLPLYWIPQNGGLWPQMTATQHLTTVSQNAECADEILSLLNLSHRQLAYPGELSEGERSRLSLGRALASRAAVLLMDEPLSHVDPVRKPEFWNVIRTWVEREGISIVFSCHEPDIVLKHSEHVVCLQDGQVVHSGRTTDLYHQPPSRMVGEFVGALNWFEADDRNFAMLPGLQTEKARAESNRAAFGIRPERLQLMSDPAGLLELMQDPLPGPISESHVRHVESGHRKTVYHQGNSNVTKGDRVTLQLAGN
jgi:iron(III) transport system ATP-binding protein